MTKPRHKKKKDKGKKREGYEKADAPPYFIGFQLPEHLREKLKASMNAKALKKAEVKWTPNEELHLTLTFLRSVHNNRLDELKSQIKEAAKHKALELQIKGLNILEKKDKWILVLDVTMTRALSDLRDGVIGAANDAGLDPVNRRGFSPHIKIGEIARPQTKKQAGRIDAFLNANYGKMSGKIDARDISLMRSSDGTKPYEIILTEPFQRL